MIPVPRIPQVEPNQKLGFGLVNHIIKRTEYAAELLRQYKCAAGDNMFAEPHPDGTRISYLQAVGGGATPTIPILPYTVVGGAVFNGKQRGFIFKDGNYELIDYPGSTSTSFADIENSKIVGNAIVNGKPVGFLYVNGIFTDIKRGSLETFVSGISGSNICGYANHGFGSFRGFVYNGINFTDILYPGATTTFIRGIEGETLCGDAFFSLGGLS